MDTWTDRWTYIRTVISIVYSIVYSIKQRPSRDKTERNSVLRQLERLRHKCRC